MITRRRVVFALGTAVLASPLASFAQQRPDGRPRIGFLPLGSPSSNYDQSLVEAFRQGLREIGLVENRDLSLDIMWTNNESEYDKAVIQLIQRGASLLITAGTSASVAAKRETSTIPIVFTTVGDPVGVGLVNSLARPGGNATGFREGALIAYGPDYAELNRGAASYVDKILKGAKPGDLPVQQPTKLDLVINLKTARALGVLIPQSLIVRANDVIV